MNADSTGAYKCLSPEDVDVTQWYTFSVNPCDDFQYFDSENSIQRYTNFHKKAITYLLQSVAPAADYELFIEVSKGTRLHMHGIIKIKDVFVFYVDSLVRLRRYGTYEIDTIQDKSKWEEYQHKGKVYMGDRPRRITSKIAKEILTTPKFFIQEIKTTEHKPQNKGHRGRPVKLSVNIMDP